MLTTEVGKYVHGSSRRARGVVNLLYAVYIWQLYWYPGVYPLRLVELTGLVSPGPISLHLVSFVL